VSLQLKTLEQICGQKLIERKRCVPTPAGKRLYERALGILANVESAVKEVKDFDDAATQSLRAGAGDTTALYILPSVLQTFSRAMPNARVMLVNRPTTSLVEMVLRGNLDIAIVTLPLHHVELDSNDVCEEQLVAVAPRGHRLANRRTLALSDLSKEPILLLDPNTRTGTILTDFFRDHSFTPMVLLESGSFEVIKRYVATGLGIAFLPEIALTASDKGIVKLAVRGLPVVRLGAIWRRQTYQTRAAQLFLELVEHHAKKIKQTR